MSASESADSSKVKLSLTEAVLVATPDRHAAKCRCSVVVAMIAVELFLHLHGRIFIMYSMDKIICKLHAIHQTY